MDVSDKGVCHVMYVRYVAHVVAVVIATSCLVMRLSAGQQLR